jgi:predicted house-cleaning noncanonical NTP pyrophosphatase (MazG superfamily)
MVQRLSFYIWKMQQHYLEKEKYSLIRNKIMEEEIMDMLQQSNLEELKRLKVHIEILIANRRRQAELGKLLWGNK